MTMPAKAARLSARGDPLVVCDTAILVPCSSTVVVPLVEMALASLLVMLPVDV